jgi:3-(3-hydroxy-phenyl)propionate hydroxylase
MPPNRSIARLRDAAFRAIAKVPGAAHAITRKVVEPTPLGRGCLTTAPRKRFPVGYLLTPARVAMADAQQVMVDQALGLGWSILGMDVDPRDDMTPENLAAWQRIGTRFLTVRPGTSVVVDGELGDPSGELWDAMAANGSRYLVVRPDRYVYQATDDGRSIAPPMFYLPTAVDRASA